MVAADDAADRHALAGGEAGGADLLDAGGVDLLVGGAVGHKDVGVGAGEVVGGAGTSEGGPEEVRLTLELAVGVRGVGGDFAQSRRGRVHGARRIGGAAGHHEHVAPLVAPEGGDEHDVADVGTAFREARRRDGSLGHPQHAHRRGAVHSFVACRGVDRPGHRLYPRVQRVTPTELGCAPRGGPVAGRRGLGDHTGLLHDEHGESARGKLVDDVLPGGRRETPVLGREERAAPRSLDDHQQRAGPVACRREVETRGVALTDRPFERRALGVREGVRAGRAARREQSGGEEREDPRGACDHRFFLLGDVRFAGRGVGLRGAGSVPMTIPEPGSSSEGSVEVSARR